MIHIATFNIQGLNEGSNEFKTEIKNNIGENKECEDKTPTPNVQKLANYANNKQDNNGRNTWLALSIQCDAIWEVCNATKKMTLKNTKIFFFRYGVRTWHIKK